MTTLSKAEEAKKVYEELKSIEKLNIKIYWEKAKLYWKLKTGLYKYVFGEETQSWSSFISEISHSLSSADQKVRSYEFFVNRHKYAIDELMGLDTSALFAVVVYKSDSTKEKVDKYLETIREDSFHRQTFIDNLRGFCGHMDVEEEKSVAIKCKHCKKKVGTKHLKQHGGN